MNQLLARSASDGPRERARNPSLALRAGRRVLTGGVAGQRSEAAGRASGVGRAGVWLLCLALLAMAAAGCGRAPADSPPPGAAPATPSVTVVKPERHTIRRTISQPGQIEAFQQTPIYVKIAGYVSKVNVDIGDPVRQGDPLAELDVPELQEELQQKKALVLQAAAEIEQARKALAAAEASILTAEASYRYWKSQYDRLTKSKVVDPQTVDEARQQAETAEAALKESKAKRDKAAADVDVARARQRVAEADERRLTALFAYTKILAPYKGIVTQRHVDLGHFVQPLAGGGKAEPLFVVVQTDPVRIFVDVPHFDAAWIKDGDTARVRIQALRGQEFEGRVTRNAWALDYSSGKVARTLRTEIDLPNPKDPDNPQGKLRPGMYVSASITMEHRNVWTLPASAIIRQGEETFCWQVLEGKAVRTALQIGASDGQRIEVVQQKFGKEAPWQDPTGTEQIIDKNPGAFQDGQEVRPVSE